MIALIAKGNSSIVEIFDAVPSLLRLPNGDQVAGAAADWSNDTYRLVPVVRFVPPAGQVATGSPSYSFDGTNVIETYATIAAPLPLLTYTQFRALFTAAEIAAIMTAATQSGAVLDWLTQADGAGPIDMGNPQVRAGLDALVAAGLLTADREKAILAGQAPGA